MSSVADYFSSAISNTYNETVDYWSKDGSIADAADAIAWSVQNTDKVAAATSKGISKSVNELESAAKKDMLKLAALVAAALYVYHRFVKGGK